MTSLAGTITESIFSNDVQVIGYPVLVTDSFRTPDLISAIRAYPQTITDGIGVQPAMVPLLGVVVAELLNMQETLLPNQLGHLSLVDSIFAHDAIIRGLPLTLTDGIGVQLVQTAAQLVRIVEALGLGDIIAPAALYKLSVAERLSLADSLARFIGAGIVENLQLVEVVAGSALKPGTITDGVGINPNLNGRLLLRAIVAEGVDLTDAELIKMTFHAGMVEGIEIIGAYVGPNGSVTTWAMNTRTGGVTEYRNYAFNSFARMGDKYLGATRDGLYELLGDKDDGTNIIATIRSGYAQWGGTHLGGFKAAYLATTGEGAFVLKVITKDGNTYIYNVVTKDGRSAKVDLGKGLRSRYFAFELVSSGQDFDLDTLEFVPLVADRRV